MNERKEEVHTDPRKWLHELATSQTDCMYVGMYNIKENQIKVVVFIASDKKFSYARAEVFAPRSRQWFMLHELLGPKCKEFYPHKDQKNFYQEDEVKLLRVAEILLAKPIQAKRRED